MPRYFFSQAFKSLAFGEDTTVYDMAKKALSRIIQLNEIEKESRTAAASLLFWQRQALDEAARAALNLGRAAEAETAARALAALPPHAEDLEQRSYLDQPSDPVWGGVLLAQAVVEQGRKAEALQTLEPVLAHYHDVQAQGATYLAFRQHFARALYVQALAQPAESGGMARGREELDQAAALLQGLSNEARQLHDSKQLLSWIAVAQKKFNPDVEAKK